MNIIFKITTKIINIKPDIYPNISIDNVGNLDKCVGNHIEKTSNNWKSEMKPLSNINEYISIALSIIFGEITAENITNIKTMIGLNLDIEPKELIPKIISEINTNDIDFINNSVIEVYNNFLQIIPDKSCKLKIFKIPNISGNNLIKIIDELIQNNYSKIEILDSFKVLSGNERYKFNKISEIFLSNKELDNKNKLVELYNNIKKLYYRQIFDFDDINLTAKIVKKSNISRQSEESCFVNNKEEQYINIISGRRKYLKNSSKFNNRFQTLSDKDMAYIFKLNTELTSCISISSGETHFKNTGTKKKLVYKPR